MKMQWFTRLFRSLPFSPSTTPLQATTYLLGISLFSISFLVFLNATVSFVITDLLGVKSGVGDIVGTLGFVDEIVVLVACPVWGLASDRLGVRWVAVCGYTIIAIALVVFVNTGGHGKEGVGGLIVARIVFALGASAVATMVTALLPVLTDDRGESDGKERQPQPGLRHSGAFRGVGNRASLNSGNPRSSVAMSVESDATITPERFVRSRQSPSSGQSGASNDGEGKKPSALAGYVGLFTGCGALVALVVFLPLPASFSERDGVTPAQAVTYSFYVVAAVALAVAVFVFGGLSKLKGEENKGWSALLGLRTKNSESTQTHRHSFASFTSSTTTTGPEHMPYHKLLISSLKLGLSDSHIALGYLGGFVARASTVAISLFIPLYVNSFFIGNGFCVGSPNDPSPELKEECRSAYVLSSILSGVAQLIALICAPVFGYFNASHRARWGGVNLPVLVATACGIIGYAAFPQLESPEYKNVDGRGGGGGVFVIVALLGISQIGAIVCSLGSLGRGVLANTGEGHQEPAPPGGEGHPQIPSIMETPATGDEGPPREISRGESEPLLAETQADSPPTNGNGTQRQHIQQGGVTVAKETRDITRVQLKGSIAGVYSWCGGVAILLLTKLGGYLFDVTSSGAPFYMMAVFNAILFVASLGIDATAMVLKGRQRTGPLAI